MMKAIIKLTCTILLFIVSVCVWANTIDQNHNNRLDSAYIAYQNGAYDVATDLYQTIVQEGYNDSQLYYNLANCYYKLEQWGQAILWYKRALRLNPNDKLAQSNLELARQKKIDSFSQSSGSIDSAKTSIIMFLTPNQWAICSIFLCLIMFFSIGVYLIGQKRNHRQIAFHFGWISLILWGGNLTAMSISKRHLDNDKDAVITAYETEFLSTPNKTKSLLYVIHSGTELSATEQVEGEYTFVTISDGSEGWVKTEDFERIVTK